MSRETDAQLAYTPIERQGRETVIASPIILGENGPELIVPHPDHILEYIRAMVLHQAKELLVLSRKTSGLTQLQVALLLEKEQANIARWEKDEKGTVPLFRYVDMLLVEGMVPVITLRPLAQVQKELSTLLPSPEQEKAEKQEREWVE